MNSLLPNGQSRIVTEYVLVKATALSCGSDMSFSSNSCPQYVLNNLCDVKLVFVAMLTTGLSVESQQGVFLVPH